MKYALLALLLLSSGAFGYPLVYTFQPRDTSPVEGATLGGIPVTIDEGANWQIKMDAGRLFEHTESNLGIDYRDGRPIEVIEDCTSKPEVCAAQSATVSPDAQWVVYQKSVGNSLRPINVLWTRSFIKDQQFAAHTNELWAYHIPTKRTVRLTTGHQDIMPTFCGDGRVLFSSDREGHYIPYTTIQPYRHKAMQIHSARFDNGKLTNVKNLTPHEVLALSPECLTNGQIIYSSFQGYNRRAEQTSTPQNLVWVAIMDGNGSNALTIFSLGAHNSPYNPLAAASEIVDKSRIHKKVGRFLILRPCRQIGIDENGNPVVGCGDYYRANHVGGGGSIQKYTVSDVEGVSIRNNWKHRYHDSSQEGSGQFVPEDLESWTKWAHGFDEPVNFHVNGKALGKASYPFALPGAQWGFTWNRGACYSPVMSWWWKGKQGTMATIEAMGGEPTCQQTLCIAKYGPVRDPFTDCELIQDWDLNIWDAKPIATYQELWGQPGPTVTAPILKGGDTELRVVDFPSTELTGAPTGDPKQVYKNRILNQGNATPDVEDRMDQFCVDVVEPWTSRPNRPGYKSRELLECVTPAEDGSVVMKVPPETQLLMYGIDSDFKFPEDREPTWQECINVLHGLCVVAEDLTLHSLREGEKRTCHGCHNAHGKEEMDRLKAEWVEKYPGEPIIRDFAAQRFSKTESANPNLPPGC